MFIIHESTILLDRWIGQGMVCSPYRHRWFRTSDLDELVDPPEATDCSTAPDTPCLDRSTGPKGPLIRLSAEPLLSLTYLHITVSGVYSQKHLALQLFQIFT